MSKIFYLCDRRKCVRCSYPMCAYTGDILHAVNFVRGPSGSLYEEPAAEVAKVVRGRWEVYLGGKELMCSACSATFWDENGSGGSSYCPNCGARMDGEE